MITWWALKNADRAEWLDEAGIPTPDVALAARFSTDDQARSFLWRIRKRVPGGYSSWVSTALKSNDATRHHVS